MLLVRVQLAIPIMPILKNKTIVFLLPRLDAGGVESWTVEAATAVKLAGGRAIIASSHGRMVALAQKKGAIFYPMPFSKTWQKFRWVYILYRLIKLLRQERVDLIYAGSRYPAWFGYCASRFCHVPLITGFHGAYGGNQFFLKKFYNQIMIKGDRVHAVSYYIKEFILKYFSIDEKKIVVIQGGVDCQKIKPTAVSQKQQLACHKTLKTLFPNIKNPKIIFMAGRLSKIKGQVLLLQSFLTLLQQDKNQQLTDWVLLLQSVGKVSLYQQLQKIIKASGYQTRIGFYPYQKNLLPMIKRAQICVNATNQRPESFGRVVVEYMAMEKLVLAPNHGGALEQITDGVDGFLFQAGDAKDLTQQLKRMINLPNNIAKDIRIKARLKIIKNFLLEKKMTQLIKLFDATMAIKI